MSCQRRGRKSHRRRVCCPWKPSCASQAIPALPVTLFFFFTFFFFFSFFFFFCASTLPFRIHQRSFPSPHNALPQCRLYLGKAQARVRGFSFCLALPPTVSELIPSPLSLAHRLLPAPVHQHPGQDYDQQQYSGTITAPVARIPPYGQRSGWKPKKPEDFGDGGAFPEIHTAQYPLDMGRKKKVCDGSVSFVDCAFRNAQLHTTQSGRP